MNYTIDLHNHSVASGHAFSTLEEMINYSKKNKIDMFALTDHGPAMPGSQTKIYFELLPELPTSINGVKILKGIEANIIDYNGSLDLEECYLKKLDIVIASFHDACIMPADSNIHTSCILEVIKNPYVDILGHLGNEVFKVDYEQVVKSAGENGKLIEINNHSFTARRGSKENCREIALLCKKYKVRVVCGSDSHIASNIGELSLSKKLLEDIDMPEELILNTSIDRITSYLKEKRMKNTGI